MLEPSGNTYTARAIKTKDTKTEPSRHYNSKLEPSNKRHVNKESSEVRLFGGDSTGR